MDIQLIAALVFIVILLAATALAVAAELAVVDADKEHIKYLASNRRYSSRASAELLLNHIKNKSAIDQCASACQIIITISSLILGVISEKYIAEFFIPIIEDILHISHETAAHAAKISLIVFFTLLQVLLGELLPKSIANRFKEQTALLLIWPVDLIMKLFYPLISILNGSGLLILKILNIKTGTLEEDSSNNLDDILTMVRDSAANGCIDSEDKERLTSALGFSDLKVKNVFFPIAGSALKADSESDDISSSCEYEASVRFAVKTKEIDKNAVLNQEKISEQLSGDDECVRTLISLHLDDDMESVLKRFDSSPYSRLPVYGKGDECGRIIGLVHIKDVSFAVAKGVTDKVCCERGCDNLSQLSLEEFDAACSEFDSKIAADIDRELKAAVKAAEDKFEESLNKIQLALRCAEGHVSEDFRKNPGNVRIFERAKHREIKLAENRAGERTGSELLFPHGFLKRDLFVVCSMEDDLADVRDRLNSSYAALAVVEDEDHKVLGILTSEDILEVLLGSNIADEADSKYELKRELKRRQNASAVRVSKNSTLLKDNKGVKPAGKGGR